MNYNNILINSIVATTTTTKKEEINSFSSHITFYIE
jgi:hypothetical protein